MGERHLLPSGALYQVQIGGPHYLQFPRPAPPLPARRSGRFQHARGAAAAAGYSTVIDMRAAGEDRGLDEPRVVAQLGMTYLSFPIASEDDISFEKAAALEKILQALPRPVLVHCASGNRVGALFALRAKNLGAASEDALAIGKAAGLTRLENVVLQRLNAK